jgi:hypothetical protein
MSQNFINARRLRRAVVAEFEQQQKADAEAAKRIRDCILVNTKDLLESLSTMLEGYCEQSGISGAERDLFSTISPSVSLDGWLACRKSHAGSERRAVSLREELRQAQKNYNDAAPWGPYPGFSRAKTRSTSLTLSNRSVTSSLVSCLP